MTFRDFLENERRRRDLSVRAFAELLGVTHGTISSYLAPGNTDRPKLDTLLQFHERLNVPIRYLLELAYPEIDFADPLNIESRVLAQQIDNLPDEYRRLVYALIRGM